MVVTIMFDGFVGLIATFSMAFIGTQIGNNVDFMITSFYIHYEFTPKEPSQESQLFTAIFVLIASSAIAIVGQDYLRGILGKR